MGFRKRKQQPQTFRETAAIQRASKDAKKAAEKSAEKKTGAEAPV